MKYEISLKNEILVFLKMKFHFLIIILYNSAQQAYPEKCKLRNQIIS
jgi:hypothetical protein